MSETTDPGRTRRPRRPMPPALVFRLVNMVWAGLLIYSRDLVFLLRPDLAGRRDAAQACLEDPDPVVAKAALKEFAAVHQEAMDIARYGTGAGR
ncbi:hypothetical protein SUDANB145_07269 (plasmid) [Streptomyces sp. enrichment culture]|uniref:hypothetical protein n=1 Tax=Streptomyces sp. enrichment culture TaxID=1795815 RepID=UPI003F57947E